MPSRSQRPDDYWKLLVGHAPTPEENAEFVGDLAALQVHSSVPRSETVHDIVKTEATVRLNKLLMCCAVRSVYGLRPSAPDPDVLELPATWLRSLRAATSASKVQSV